MAWTKVGLYHYPKRKLPWLVRWFGEIDPKTGTTKRYGKSFRTKREAEDFRLAKVNEFKKGIRRDRPEEITLARLCGDFLETWSSSVRKSTIDLYKDTIRRLLNYFGEECRIQSIGPKKADSFLATQIHYLKDPNRKLSVWSRLQIISHCKTIFNTAVRWQWLVNNPFANAKKPKPGTKRWHRMTVTEFQRLLEAAPTLRWKVFYALAYTSGARSGELFNLTWADIDFEKGRLYIQNREGTDTMSPFFIKDSEARYVQLPTQTIELLTRFQQEAPTKVPYILLTTERYKRVLGRWHRYRKEDKPWQNRYMVNNVLRDFKSHAKRAGLQFNGNFTVHTFRKTCAQNWADRLPANVVKFFLGHSNLNTTNRFYSIVDDSHMVWTKQAMDKMLKSGKESAFDTEQTLRHKNNQKPYTKKEAIKVAHSVTPSKISTSNEHKNGRCRT